MKEIPILFSGPMVRAILDGRKTQTRRFVTKKHLPFVENLLGGLLDGKWNQRPFPYGKPGDHLWVRETWSGPTDKQVERGALQIWAYRATDEAELLKDGVKCKWRPAIHMPRSRCRITLEVTHVRVERLQKISEADAKAEGCTQDADFSRDYPYSYVDQFHRLWNEINGKRAPWVSNPWVWVVEFKPLLRGE